MFALWFMNITFSFLQYSAGFEPSKGRLNHPTSYIAKTNDIGQWIQVDLGEVAKVTRIGTQGRYNVGQWVTKFIVSYSIDGGYFEFQTHKSYNVPRVSCKLVGFLNLYLAEKEDILLTKSPMSENLS